MVQRLDDSSSDYEKALSLVLRGKRSASSEDQTRSEQDIVTYYFASITATDIESTLAEFEYSLDVTHRKEAAQALIAYFNWCWQCGKQSASDKTPINNYVLKFAQIALKRIAGFPPEQEDSVGDEVIPKWVNPNVAFGWSNPAHRPRGDTFMRDLAIAAYVEKLRREGDEPVMAKKRAAEKFGLKLPTVEKALAWDELTESTFGRRFERFTTEELAAMVKEEIEEIHQRKNKKRSP